MNNKKLSIMLSLIFIICLFSISAEAEQIAPPVEKMQITSTDEAPSVPGRMCLALHLSVFMILQLRR